MTVFFKKISLLLLLIIFVACNGQEKKEKQPEKKFIYKVSTLNGPELDPALQVSQYIRKMYEDKNGNLWFGTNGDGVARYDRDTLVYFTMKEGFGGSAVRGIVEDERGDLWFATDGGVSRYNANLANSACIKGICKHTLKNENDLKDHKLEREKLFTNFTMMHGLANNQVWSILQDKKKNFWFGTENGISRYDRKCFTKFALPVPDLKDFPEAYQSPKLINCIYEDKSGDIWFGSNGGGVYRYDGNFLNNLSEKDGLCNNFVQCIHQDREGNFWFGTRFGGISFYDTRSFPITQPSFNTYTLNFKAPEGLSKNFIWTFLEDRSEKLWIGTAGGGLYRYEGSPNAMGVRRFTQFGEKEGLPNRFIQSILQDRNGILWIGSSGGLFRYDEKNNRFINVTKNGPWK